MWHLFLIRQNSFSTYTQFSAKPSFLTPWYARVRTCVFLGIGDVGFSEIFAYVLNVWSVTSITAIVNWFFHNDYINDLSLKLSWNSINTDDSNITFSNITSLIGRSTLVGLQIWARRVKMEPEIRFFSFFFFSSLVHWFSFKLHRIIAWRNV